MDYDQITLENLEKCLLLYLCDCTLMQMCVDSKRPKTKMP